MLSDRLEKYGCEAQKRQSSYFEEAVEDISNYRAEENKLNAMCRAGSLTMPGLLKEDFKDISVGEDTETKRASPVLKFDGESIISDTTVYILMAERLAVAFPNTFFEAVAMWVASFYVSNSEFPGQLADSLTFIQNVIFNVDDQLPPIENLTHNSM